VAQLLGSLPCTCLNAPWSAIPQAWRVHLPVQIFLAPEQWSFPLRLPSAFFGIFNSVSIQPGERYPWSADFDHRVLTVNTSKGCCSTHILMLHVSVWPAIVPRSLPDQQQSLWLGAVTDICPASASQASGLPSGNASDMACCARLGATCENGMRLVVGVGPYSEVALFHKASRTLLLVDAAVSVPKQPPPVIPRWALADAGDSSNFFVRLLYGDASKQVAQYICTGVKYAMDIGACTESGVAVSLFQRICITRTAAMSPGNTLAGCVLCSAAVCSTAARLQCLHLRSVSCAMHCRGSSWRARQTRGWHQRRPGGSALASSRSFSTYSPVKLLANRWHCPALHAAGKGLSIASSCKHGSACEASY
jgi:Domain of unknown function (DUF4336)